ncbi:hypothetical protein GCM10009654_67180 [Streptomyces hebeiensis]|uniref:WXG100 family type VII secretion target n=1 Tax=Streptomyces hebeiensis TaxID=229486 RepID=A0ABP4FWU4_9ACTN
MPWDLKISASELRASAGAADDLVTDLGPSLKRAVDDLCAAAASFGGWSAGPRIEETGDGWGTAIGALRDNLTQHAQGLRLLANGRDVVESDVIACFRGW